MDGNEEFLSPEDNKELPPLSSGSSKISKKSPREKLRKTNSGENNNNTIKRKEDTSAHNSGNNNSQTVIIISKKIKKIHSKNQKKHEKPEKTEKHKSDKREKHEKHAEKGEKSEKLEKHAEKCEKEKPDSQQEISAVSPRRKSDELNPNSNNNNIPNDHNQDIPKTLTAASKPKYKFEDLPLEVQKECTHLDKELIDKHMDVLMNILQFLYKQHFINFAKNNTNNNNNHKRQSEDNYESLNRASLSDEKFAKAKSLLSNTSTKTLKKKNFKKFTMSGKGAFGSVFLAKDKILKKSVAIKKLPNDSEKFQHQNIIEIYFLSESHHPNIVEFIKCYEVKSKGQPQVWIEMEYLEGGTLGEAAQLYTFSEKHVAYISRECLKGIQYLHERGFAHRDLKSSNVMMSVKGDVKLIDFGLCADFQEGPRKKMMGSPYWVPPEMIRNHTHSYPVDIWSFAVCILELFLSGPPYPESPVKCMLMAATKGLKDQIPETASADAKEFLGSCLTVDPDQRATAEQLLKHNWVMQQNLEEGIEEILYQIFLSNSLSVLGL